MEKMIHLKKIKNNQEILCILNKFSNCLESLKQGGSFRKNMADKFALYAEFVLAYENDDNIGFIAYYANDNIAKTVYITMIAVSPMHRNKGVGGGMLERCIADAIDKEMNIIKLEVGKDNFKAQKFYEKYGFVVDGETSENTFYMKKMIGKNYE